MTMLMRLSYIVLLLLMSKLGFAQEYKFIGDIESQTVSFKLINNLIIIPLEINGNPLNFILDSGVSTPVIFNLKTSDSIQLNQLKKIKLRGLGDGDPVEALQSKNNRIRFENIWASNQDLYLIYHEKLDVSAKLGITVNGIIGYDLFNDFVVTINYRSRKITFTKPETYNYKNCRKCESFDLFFYKKKPYINAEIVVIDSIEHKIPVQLLIDSGGTDSLWLFEDEEKGINVPDNAFKDLIGEGISGEIIGMRGKINSFNLKRFQFKNANVAYLDSLSSFYARSLKTRNGSLGGDILRRFKVVLDYPNAKMTLKKNGDFNDKFSYNMSGIELVHAGTTLVKEKRANSYNIASNDNISEGKKIVFDYSYAFVLKPVYKIAYLREGSPAEKVGVQEEDLLIKINGKSTNNFTIDQIISNFYEENEKIKITVDRNGRELNFEFVTKNLLKK